MRKILPYLTRRTFALFCAAAIVGGCATGSGSGPSGSGSEPVSRTAGPAQVALLAPLGAANPGAAGVADAIVKAAQLAVEQNGSGVVDLRILDTRGDAGQAAAAAQQAVAGGAEIILGPLFGANTPAVAQIARAAGIKVVSFSTDTTVAGDPVYVSGFTPEANVRRILDFASRQGLSRVAVYAPSEPGGDAAVRGVARHAGPAGVQIVAETRYPRSVQDIERTAPIFAASARQAGAQALLLPDFGEGLPFVASFMNANGLPQPDVRYLGIGQWAARTTLGKPELLGGWFAGADPQAAATFAARYRARYGETPPFIAVLGYDAVSMVIQLLRADPTAGFDTAAITRPQGFAGGVGPFRFNRDGQAERGLAILEVGATDFRVIEPAPASFGAGS